MSFGGENSSSGTTAHKHTNATGDGSSLDTTSLINEAPLFSLMVAL
jgi:hypothetical protein|tara:strand:- start:230 stop:367 length:138 start_codon:yes stop_codon:yes gene_type:complete